MLRSLKILISFSYFKITIFIYCWKEKGKKIDFDWNCLLDYWASSSRLSLFDHHVVGNVKLDVQEKLFVLTTFSGLIRLCRVSIMQYIELLDKKLTGRGPEISVHPVSLSFCLFLWTFFLTENREFACFTGDYSALTNRFSSIM